MNFSSTHSVCAGNDLFDRSQLRLLPLRQRVHDFNLSEIAELETVAEHIPALEAVAESLIEARRAGAAVILMLGAHLLRSGVQRYLIDLMEQGFFSSIAGNGAVAIHDYELALIGATTESVAHYIRDGKFGLWHETGKINDIVREAAARGRGAGEEIGRVIFEEEFPHRDISVLANGYRLGIPVTIHVGIGYDIVFEHPNCDGAAWGSASYTDFLRLTRIMQKLEHGVVMNFGSAVMSPEVFLKALSMVRNVASRQGQGVQQFTVLVCDLVEMPDDYRLEPCRSDPRYYFRPWKTMLARAVADGGQSFYVRGHHAQVFPQLWQAICSRLP